VKRLRGRSSSNGGRSGTKLLGTVELLLDGEDGVTKLLDLEVSIERLLGLRDKKTSELGTVFDILLKGSYSIFVCVNGVLVVLVIAIDYGSEVRGNVQEGAEETGIVDLEFPSVGGVGIDEGDMVGGLLRDQIQSDPERI